MESSFGITLVDMDRTINTYGLPIVLIASHPSHHKLAMTALRAASTSPADEFDFDIMTIGAGSGGVRGSRFAASYGGRADHAWVVGQWMGDRVVGS